MVGLANPEGLKNLTDEEARQLAADMDRLKATGADLGKLSAGLAAALAGKDIDTAVTTGGNAAEHNALIIIPIVLELMDKGLQAYDAYRLAKAIEAGDTDEATDKLPKSPSEPQPTDSRAMWWRSRLQALSRNSDSPRWARRLLGSLGMRRLEQLQDLLRRSCLITSNAMDSILEQFLRLSTKEWRQIFLNKVIQDLCLIKFVQMEILSVITDNR